MTLDLFLPLLLAAIALTEVPLFLHWRAKGIVSESAFPILAIASVALPFIAYVVLNLIRPDLGAIEVF
ncbi:MAG: hypothetical protein ABJ239_06235 [Erythrobacter sp.]